MYRFNFTRLISNWKRKASKMSLTQAFSPEDSRKEVYEQLTAFFNTSLPRKFTRHRKYFSENRRGFGEDAFHSMWFLLFSEFKPVHCLEIGVYRGQTLTLWQLLAKYNGYVGNFAGISPFSSIGDSVSTYPEKIDYLADTKNNHHYFGLELPKFLIDYSNSPAAEKFITSRLWDLIYIDGSHDYDVVCRDFELSLRNLADGGLIVMDDSSLFFEYEPLPGSFAGHPGPSRVAKEIAMIKMQLLGGVGHNNIFKKGNLKDAFLKY